MPQNDLTLTHLRALIAAATPGPWTMDVHLSYDSESIELTVSIPEISKTRILTEAQLSDWENQVPNLRLLEALVNHASALADALEAKKLLDALMGYVLSVRRGNTNEWMEGLVETLNATEMAIGGKDRCEYRRSDGVIRVRRAAKEAHDGNI